MSNPAAAEPGSTDLLKFERLVEILQGMRPLLVAYSGGVDSTLLAAAAGRALGGDWVAVTAVSPSLARADRERARRVASRFGWPHRELESFELDRPEYRANASDRCFHCKTELFEKMSHLATELGWSTIAYGAIPEDQDDFRPGARAARLAGVREPLVEVGLDKPALRRLSRWLGLETWDLQAGACLSSRIAFHTPVTREKLEAVERAEELLRGLGFPACRVRHHDGLARLEVPVERIAELAGHAGTLSESLRALGFRYVTIDLEGLRSGSMHRTLRVIS